ncbi:glucokinase [Massilia sp. H-1]|nr:glucokinase [Massilia sp. H-1]
MVPGSYPDGPRLLADIGGTKRASALESAPGRIGAMQNLACADYPRFEDAARAYLARPRRRCAPCRHRHRQPGRRRCDPHDQS